jgi:hypothetical protein
MSNEQVTYIVAGVCGLVALGAYVSLLLIPAWTSYGRIWERVCAAFLSIYVLLAFIGMGAVTGLGVAWFWDRIQGGS